MGDVRIHSVLQLAGARRDLMPGLASLPLLGGSGLLSEDAAAQRGRRGNAAQAEKKRWKRRQFCLHGQQVKARNKKKKRRLTRQGATRGKCPPCTPESFTATCAARCGTVKNNCGETVECGFSATPPVSANVATFGSIAMLNDPYSLTLSADALLMYSGDYTNDRISVWFRPNASSVDWTNLTAIAIGAGTGPDAVTFSADEMTMSVAYGDADQVGIWTRPSTGVQTWTEQATIGVSGSGPNELNAPGTLALSPDELIMYIADSNNSRISVWSRASATTTVWSNLTTFGSAGSGPDGLSEAACFSITADGLAMYIADYGNNRVSVWTRPNRNGQAWSNAAILPAATGASPYGLTLRGDELTMWTADYGTSTVSIWSRPSTASLGWAIQSSFGSQGSGPNEFDGPLAITKSADGALLYISEYGNDRVSIWSQTCPA